MSAKRYVIEGEWSGYRSSQQRIVHRTVTTDAKLVEWINNTYSISYTDGTCLCLSARECKPREQVKDLRDSYGSLIRDCARYDVASVDALQAARKAGAK